MRRLIERSTAALLIAVLLSACAMFSPPAKRLTFGMLPTAELGYEVDSSGGITIESRQFQFSNPAGMPFATVTGYRAVFRDQAGAIVGQTSTQPQSLNINVPAGYICTTPDATVGCTPLSEGARPAPGPVASGPTVSSQLLNADIAQAHIMGADGVPGTPDDFPTGWYADITFSGNDAYGDFEETYRVMITAPN